MEGMIGMDNDWVVGLLIIVVGILPILLAFIQLPLAIHYTILRIKTRKKIIGWVIYWLLTVSYAVYFFLTEKHGMAHVPAYFLLCYVPALWFFFAGKLSNYYSKKAVNQ